MGGNLLSFVNENFPNVFRDCIAEDLFNCNQAYQKPQYCVVISWFSWFGLATVLLNMAEGLVITQRKRKKKRKMCFYLQNKFCLEGNTKIC